eukprot:SAG11_NODE_582_length_8353_cov_28.953356_1_plen_55_part_00
MGYIALRNFQDLCKRAVKIVIRGVLFASVYLAHLLLALHNNRFGAIQNVIGALP